MRAVRYEAGTHRIPGSVDLRIALVAAVQDGVFSYSQVTGVGASRSLIGRRVSSGRWEPLPSGVFRIVGAPPSWRQSLMAACLLWGDGAGVSHRAAAVLWRVPGFERDRLRSSCREA